MIKSLVNFNSVARGKTTSPTDVRTYNGQSPSCSLPMSIWCSFELKGKLVFRNKVPKKYVAFEIKQNEVCQSFLIYHHK